MTNETEYKIQTTMYSDGNFVQRYFTDRKSGIIKEEMPDLMEISTSHIKQLQGTKIKRSVETVMRMPKLNIDAFCEAN
jgi:hypothetical protein